MNKAKLQEIVDLLEKIPEESFSLTEWKRETPCGTVLCAIGHAIQNGIFPDYTFATSVRANRTLYWVCHIDDLSKSVDMWSVVCEQLGIEEHLAFFLFREDKYAVIGEVTTKDVICRVKNFMTEGEL